MTQWVQMAGQLSYKAASRLQRELKGNSDIISAFGYRCWPIFPCSLLDGLMMALKSSIQPVVRGLQI